MGEKIYFSNTQPGAGTYRCQKCGYEMTLQDNEELPLCPMCGFDKWDKIA